MGNGGPPGGPPHPGGPPPPSGPLPNGACYVSTARVARLERVLDCDYFGGSVPVSGASWYEADE
jgi:hypothetical protein